MCAVEVADGPDRRGDDRGGAAGRRLGCLLPAPVNLHRHAFQRAMAGMTERRGGGAGQFLDLARR